MKSLNKVQLIGNLGSKPELKALPSGTKTVAVSLATNESWKDKQSGEWKDRTEWHNLVLFGSVAEIAGKYLNKGSKVFVEGNLRTRKWDKDGETRSATEIVVKDLMMLDGKSAAQPNQVPAPAEARDEQESEDVPF